MSLSISSKFLMPLVVLFFAHLPLNWGGWSTRSPKRTVSVISAFSAFSSSFSMCFSLLALSSRLRSSNRYFFSVHAVRVLFSLFAIFFALRHFLVMFRRFDELLGNVPVFCRIRHFDRVVTLVLDARKELAF